MAGAETSLWPIVVGGLLGMGGTVAAAIGTAIRDEVLKRHESRKRRADKFEELVTAVYEFDHWLSAIRHRDAFGQAGAPDTVTPIAKVQSISAVYFPQFDVMVRELDIAGGLVLSWTYGAAEKRLRNDIAHISDGFNEVNMPYTQKREALLNALKKFAHKEFQ